MSLSDDKNHFIEYNDKQAIVWGKHVHNLSWGVLMSAFLYDEADDNQFCFNNEDRNEGQKGNQMVETHCYKENS
jgi:hypothetical protein